MDTNTMFSFMDILVVGCGLYMLYGYYLLQFKGIIKEGVVISKGQDASKCKDFDGFRKYLAPRLLIFAIAAVISGGLGLYQTYVSPIPSVLYWVFYVLFFAAIIWFAMASRKADKLFF